MKKFEVKNVDGRIKESALGAGHGEDHEAY